MYDTRRLDYTFGNKIYKLTRQAGGKKRKVSVTGNRTLVSRVTGGDTSHYTMTDVDVL